MHLFIYLYLLQQKQQNLFEKKSCDDNFLQFEMIRIQCGIISRNASRL